MVAARIVALLKQYGWVVNLLFIFLGAYFFSGAAAAIVARQVRVVPSADDVRPAPSARRSTGPLTKKTYSAMANRNLMGAQRENLEPIVDTGASASGSAVGANFQENDLRDCSVNGQLRGTIVADDKPEWSLAVFYINTDRASKVVSINEGSNAILDDAVLVEIRTREVVVRRTDHFERCGVDDKRGAPAVPRTTSKKEESSDGGVTKVSENNYNVTRNEVDSALGNLSKVATQARIVPSFKNGKANGFKLFSIKSKSIFSKIGLQNGDIIQKINGYEINSPDKALELYQKLKSSSSVSLDIQRRGQSRQMNYSITE